MRTDFVPQFTRPAGNRRVLLVRRPSGIPRPSDFVLDEAALEPLGEGEMMIRNIYLSVDPAQRGWASEASNYSPPVPLGAVMRALAVGEIVESRAPGFAPGEFVYGWFGWQDYAIAAPSAVLTHFRTPRAPLSAYAGPLGINGLTADIAFSSLGRPNPGDVVVVSTAACAVGGFVGQLAKAADCRAIGLAGDDEKVRRCVQRYGYECAFNYKTADIADSLAQLAPDGVDIYYDNVGGGILDTLLRRMRPAGRIVQCGTASIASWAPPPVGPRVEREILTRRLVWSGFVIFDHAARFAETVERLADMIAAGALAYDEDIETAFEAAPGAIERVYAGENRGKKLIFIG